MVFLFLKILNEVLLLGSSIFGTSGVVYALKFPGVYPSTWKKKLLLLPVKLKIDGQDDVPLKL